MRSLKFYGPLRDFLGVSEFEAEVSTPGEGVRCMIANWPEVADHMRQHDYRVLIGDDAIGSDQLSYPAAGAVVSFIPVVSGAGGDTGMIIAGVALVGFSLAFPGIGAAIGGAAMTSIGLAGGALILGGVAGMLTPTPQLQAVDNNRSQLEREEDTGESFSFSSSLANTTQTGAVVPVIFGEIYTGSVVVSAGQRVYDISAD